MGKVLLQLFIFLAVFSSGLIFTQKVQAVTVTISDVPTNISEQAFNINVSVSGAQSGTNYLRANLYLPSTTNYFGYTFNGNDFINSSDYSQYYPITIDASGNWSGVIQAKLDPQSSYYSGSGDYNLKVRRYTQSGSSYTWSNEISLSVIYATPTPSPTSIATPTPTSTPTPSVSSTPTPTPTLTPTPSPTPSSEFNVSNVPSQINSDEEFTVSVNLTLVSSPNASLYIKGAFVKSGKTNYFGFTKVGSDWIKNSSKFSDQQKITLNSSGQWNGSLQVKPDSGDSGFEGTGDYIFKVARYSESGSGPIWSNGTTINILVQVSQSPTLSPSSDSQDLVSTGLESPTSSGIIPKIPSSLLASEISGSTPIESGSTVAGVTTENPEQSTLAASQKSSINYYFLGAGVIVLLIGLGAVVFYMKKN